MFETQHTLFCEMGFLESMLVLSLKIDGTCFDMLLYNNNTFTHLVMHVWINVEFGKAEGAVNTT